MKPIRLVAVGAVERRLLEVARSALVREFRTTCSYATRVVDPAFAYHPERMQYNSTSIVEQLAGMNGTGEVIVGVTSVDLFIPILTFVFGEAQLNGHVAVVSYARLLQQFYGLPPDDALLRARLEKETVHEVGHTTGLTHCDDYACAMAATHSVEWLDLKGTSLCPVCRETGRLA